MTVLVEDVDAVAIVAPSGKLDAITAPEFDRCAGGLLEYGARRFVIDCSAVESISSAGLQSLLHFARQVGAAGGALALCGLSGVTATVIEVSGFHHVLRICRTRDEALAILAPSLPR